MELIPSALLQAEVVTLLAADPDTIAPAADACKVHLIKVEVNPDTYVFSAADEATFNGATAKSAGVGAQPTFTDPVTQDKVIQIKEPAGGWLWICVGGADPSQTIFAVCLTNLAGDETYGTVALLPPPEIRNEGDAVDVGSLELRFRAGFMDAGGPE